MEQMSLEQRVEALERRCVALEEGLLKAVIRERERDKRRESRGFAPRTVKEIHEAMAAYIVDWYQRTDAAPKVSYVQGKFCRAAQPFGGILVVWRDFLLSPENRFAETLRKDVRYALEINEERRLNRLAYESSTAQSEK